jgi:hypothetical protein
MPFTKVAQGGIVEETETIMQKTKNNQNFDQASYTVYNGDLFSFISDRLDAGANGSSIIVPHVCNNINAFGAGFAAVLADRYPVVKENYHLLGPTFLKSNLGHVQFIDVNHKNSYKHRLFFANMIAQNGLRGFNNKRPLNYAALVHSMLRIKQFIKNQKTNDSTEKFEIHCPKFGTGLAGGRWDFVSELIEDIWGDQKVFVYNYGNSR